MLLKKRRISQNKYFNEKKNEKIENNNLNNEKFKNLQENEEFILSVTDKGFGKSSAFEYRKKQKGTGLGIANMQLVIEMEVRWLHLFQLSVIS